MSEVVCPLCGNRFARDAGAQQCHDGCPMSSRCNMVMCPSCGYEWPGDSRLVQWLRRVFDVASERPPAEVTKAMMTKLKVRR